MNAGHIAAIAATAPLGLDTAAIQAELACGTVRFAETEVATRAGDPIRAARLSVLSTESSRHERMQFLAQTALRQLVPALQRWDLASVPLFVGLPDDSNAALFEAALLRAIRDPGAGPSVFRSDARTACATGRASFFEAVARGQRCLARGSEAVVVGAVDSLVDGVSLRSLADAGRILGPGRDGVLPGEGAAFAMLVREDSERFARQRATLKDRYRIVDCRTGVEPIPFSHAEPSFARGLSDAVSQLCADEPKRERVVRLISGQTGERYFAREMSAAYLRNAELMPEPFVEHGVPEHFGDVGAATGALGLLMAEWTLDRSVSGARDQRALVMASSDTGAVGALVVEAAGLPTHSLGHALARTPAPAPTPHATVRAFLSEAREEQLEDLGSMLVERALDLREGYPGWSDVEATERRIDARLDALQLGGELTLSHAERSFEDLDDDLFVGAACVLMSRFSSPARFDRVANALLDASDSRRDAFGDALGYAPHPRVAMLLHSLLEREDSLAILGLRLLGSLRKGDTLRLASLVTSSRALAVREAAARALSVLDPAAAAHPVRALVAEFPDSVGALGALTRCSYADGQRALRSALSARNPSEGMVGLFALGAEAAEASLLTGWIEGSAHPEEIVAAVGVIGRPADVPWLIEMLGEEALASSAAEALTRLTGACLEEQVADADEPDVLEVRPSQDPADWRDFWTRYRSYFEDAPRYRRGRPFNAHACLEEMQGAYAGAVRSAAADELRIRTGRPIAFEPDWPVQQQRDALRFLHAEWSAPAAQRRSL